MSKYDALKNAAEKATPGPWKRGPFGNVHLDHAPSSEGMEHGGYMLLCGHGLRNSDMNEQYVAAANPTAILALLAERDQLLEALRNLVIAADNIEVPQGGLNGFDELQPAINFADAAVTRATEES